MSRRFRGPELPVPEQVRGWADPLIFRFVALAQRVDVSGFVQDYRADGVGGLPYDPRLMLVTVWWCHHRRWRSPQDMARACREQASLRVVWQRERVPSAACLRRFVQGHRDGWQRVADSLIRVCDRAGLVDVSLTATDSTPVAAPAALSTTLTAPRITVRLDAARRELAELQAHRQAMAEDGDLDTFIEHGCGDLIRAEQLLLVRLRRLEQAEVMARRRGQADTAVRQRSIAYWQARVDEHLTGLAEMTRRQQHKYDIYQAKVAAGRRPGGAAPCLPEQHIRIREKQQALDNARSRLAQAQAGTRPARDGPAPRASITDPHPRILKGKPNTPAWILGWLLTITVISGQIILAGLLSPDGNDTHGLTSNLTAAAARCRQAGISRPFGYHLADGAFAAPDPAVINGTPLIGVTRGDPVPDQVLYARRSPMVEPVFAHLLRTDRHLHSRGDAAHTETLAMTTAYNAAKYLRKTTPPTP